MGHTDHEGCTVLHGGTVGSLGFAFAKCCCSATSSTQGHSSSCRTWLACIMYDWSVNTWSIFHCLTEIEAGHIIFVGFKSIPVTCFPHTLWLPLSWEEGLLSCSPEETTCRFELEQLHDKLVILTAKHYICCLSSSHLVYFLSLQLPSMQYVPQTSLKLLVWRRWDF